MVALKVALRALHYSHCDEAKLESTWSTSSDVCRIHQTAPTAKRKHNESFQATRASSSIVTNKIAKISRRQQKRGKLEDIMEKILDELRAETSAKAYSLNGPGMSSSSEESSAQERQAFANLDVLSVTLTKKLEADIQVMHWKARLEALERITANSALPADLRNHAAQQIVDLTLSPDLSKHHVSGAHIEEVMETASVASEQNRLVRL